ncbi:hypothetical protein VP01_2099g2 [Puccinia sorghi]|uniref:Uncharacterized protein n=1 Tax=Puccinia sorghi TaxID=27349 RepID=A0A0L6VAA3_9BASI|nr:hypothetical protein VP01_2099g2 [Puccinia sorghi]
MFFFYSFSKPQLVQLSKRLASSIYFSFNMTTEAIRESKILLFPENYALWLLPMKAKLHKNKPLQIVTGAVVCADPKKDKDNAQLYNKLNEDVATQVKANGFNSFKLWQLLKSKYAGNDLVKPKPVDMDLVWTFFVERKTVSVGNGVLSSNVYQVLFGFTAEKLLEW